MTPDLFSAALSRDARDLGLESVSDNAGDFMALALMLIGKLGSGDYSGEDIRQAVTAAGLRPHHPGAWGALVRTALKRNLIHEPGVYVSMTAVKSHARKTQLYRIEAR